MITYINIINENKELDNKREYTLLKNNLSNPVKTGIKYGILGGLGAGILGIGLHRGDLSERDKEIFKNAVSQVNNQQDDYTYDALMQRLRDINHSPEYTHIEQPIHTDMATKLKLNSNAAEGIKTPINTSSDDSSIFNIKPDNNSIFNIKPDGNSIFNMKPDNNFMFGINPDNNSPLNIKLDPNTPFNMF